MAKAKVEGYCVFCGEPAVVAILCTLRVRARPRRPTRVRVCNSCRRSPLLDELRARTDPPTQQPSPLKRSTTQ